ncbi:MAG: hypothetical protein SFW36_04500 [Leptolyngbyaceae cyanobacterium bins.59]|nr:hypothetical protein [Leptolyngbyaceae cyanobacterium bins.59]
MRTNAASTISILCPVRHGTSSDRCQGRGLVLPGHQSHPVERVIQQSETLCKDWVA